MNLLEYFVLPLISLIVLFLLTKLMGYRQVTELSLYDYIIGIAPLSKKGFNFSQSKPFCIIYLMR